MHLEETKFSIGTIEDLLRCINVASLLEVAGWPKPGNVHRTKNFHNTRFEHFLAGIAAIQPNFRELCKRAHKNSNINKKKYSFVELGTFFIDASKEMIKWQGGGNVVLGHILILAPLAGAAAICLKSKKSSFKSFVFNVNKIIADSTVKDTVNLYEAIRICEPGGLGKIDKYDIYDENSIKDIQTDKITLKKIFNLSKNRDLISHEYSTGFNIILNEGLPYFFNQFNQTQDINTSTVNTFLKILSEHPDTLIIRKSGIEAGLMVSSRASEIVACGGISTENGLKLTHELDNLLQEKGGKMNPGTTADIVVGIIFCALLFGLRF